jgi:NDP-sugar pyrophosphorylase family protein
MQVLIPMSGQGSRFRQAGYTLPKPLIPVNQIPMIERLLRKIPQEWPCTFVIAQNHEGSELPGLLKKLRPNARIVPVQKNSEGPLVAIEAALPHLDAKTPVLISYCDYGLKWDPWDFADFVKNTDCDTCVVSYRGFHSHYLSSLMYAYSKMDQEFIREIKEKGNFTDDREKEYASCGAYYFKKTSDLKLALDEQKKHDLKINGEFYTSLTVESLLRLRPETKARVYQIDAFFQWGTPGDLEDFEYWENTFRYWNQFMVNHSPLQCSQVLMPMAGKGTRFNHLFTSPKPLIPIGETAMFRKALQSLPKASQVIFVALKDVADKMAIGENEKVVRIESTPAGQALTTELGLSSLDTDLDFIVTACDHSVVLNPAKWKQFIANPDCDAAIFTIKGYTGARRNPEAFSYVESGDGEFPNVRSISVKKPFSSDARKDSLLVGSFWFKNEKVARLGIDELKKRGKLVHGELFLDSVFEVLISMGLKVKEFPLSGYVNWGDPDSLKESIYWYEIYMGRSLVPRDPFPGSR